jgi:hypothetical protein
VKALLHQIISPLNQKEIEENKLNQTKHTFLLFLISTHKWPPPYPSPSRSPPCTTKPPTLLSHATQNPFTYAPSPVNPSPSKPSLLRCNPHARRPQEARCRQGCGLRQARHSPRPRHQIHRCLRCRQARPPPPDQSTIQHRRNSHLETHQGASPPTGYPFLGPQ